MADRVAQIVGALWWAFPFAPFIVLAFIYGGKPSKKGPTE